MSGARILAVDDDPGILLAVRRALEEHGYTVQALDRGEGLRRTLHDFRPEVILLDLMLPDANGVDLCRAIRAESDTPIIVLSAIGDDATKVEALDAGADDYLTKPFSMSELQARMRVALRRTAGRSNAGVLELGPIRMDIAMRNVAVGGVSVHFTPHEFDLLRLLLQYPGRLLTARQLLGQVWGPEYVDDTHILRTFIHQLRTKLAAADPAAAAMLVNDPGIGYRMVEPKS
jgi:two-component system KDP operon response regulator KdpE